MLSIGLVLGIVLIFGIISQFLVPKKYFYLALLYVIIIVLNGIGYDWSWWDIGDGPTYLALNERFQRIGLKKYLVEYIPFISDYSLLSYLNILPVLSFSEVLDIPISNCDYFYSQILVFYLIFLSSVALFKSEMRYNLRLKRLFSLVFLMPSLLDLSSVPTRHTFTLLALLNYFSFLESIRKTPIKFIWFILSILIILYVKPAYIFVILAHLFLLNRKRILPFIIVLISLIMFRNTVSDLLLMLGHYKELYVGDQGSFASAAILGPAVIPYKILVAALSPMPWWNYSEIIDSVVMGGNEFSFINHILSASFAVFVLIIFTARLTLNKLLNDSYTIFGSLLLISLIFGAFGFHHYLIVSLPFLLVSSGINSFQDSLKLSPLALFVIFFSNFALAL